MTKKLIRRIISMIIAMILTITILYFAFWAATIEKYSWIYRDIDIWPIVWESYIDYMKNIILHWDWGQTSAGRDIAEIFNYKAHYTVKITLATTVFFIVMGMLFGYLSARYKDSWFDRFITSFLASISAIPSFVIVWLLMLWLGWGLKIFPAIYPLTSENPWMEVLAMAIPVLSLSFWPISKFTQLIRNELVDGMDAEYILLAKVKGLTKSQIMIRHLSRNALVAVSPEFTNSFLFVLGSSFLVEIVYNVPGVANLFYDSMISPFGEAGFVNIDIHTTIYIVVFYMAFGMIIASVFDFIAAILDPRIKVGQKKVNYVE